jgi:hypothetical protein
MHLNYKFKTIFLSLAVTDLGKRVPNSNNRFNMLAFYIDIIFLKIMGKDLLPYSAGML